MAYTMNTFTILHTVHQSTGIDQMRSQILKLFVVVMAQHFLCIQAHALMIINTNGQQKN